MRRPPFKALLILFMILPGFTLTTLAQTAAQRNAYRVDVFNTTNLSAVNPDQLSDEDIQFIAKQFQNNGYTLQQAESLVTMKGMSNGNWQKLKGRLQRINFGTQLAGQYAADSVNNSQQAQDSYKTAVKPVTSQVFGSSLFSTTSLAFEPNLRIATPSNYSLGPDDELQVSVSGVQEVNLRLKVQPEGTVFIPQVGTVNVNGLTIEQATALLKQRMGQTAYRSLGANLSKIVVTLGTVRSIHVTIVGAIKPGNYTVSSLSTVFNTLFLCGGPGDINTYRNIELIRNNKVIQRIDLYNFLVKGDQSGNVSLKDYDVINIPVYKKQVSVKGQVKRQGIYELKNSETLADLLLFTGGFSKKAYKASVKVKQITDVERQVKDITRAEFNTFQPQDGDEIEVDSVLNRFQNGVAIEGAVYRPGQFELTPGLTVATLIKKAGGLLDNVFIERAVITRTNPDNTKYNITFNVNDVLNKPSADILLSKRDSVTIAQASEFVSRYTVKVEGEVRKPGTYIYKQNFSMKDLLFLAGGLTDAATTYHIEVSRRITADRVDKGIDSIANVFNINTTKDLAAENERFILQPYDIVTIRRNPGYIVQQRVKISGEVNFPGTYTIRSKQERVSELLQRSGGLTRQAYMDGIFLIRVHRDSTLTHQQTVSVIQNSLRDTSSKVMTDYNRRNIRIAVNIKKVLESPGSVQDYLLQDGDSIQVLKQDPLVRVNGEVLTATETSYIEGKPLSYYLTQAGGTSRDALRSKIYVLYANGKVSRTHNGLFGLFRSHPEVAPGSEVIVPRKPEHRGLSVAETVGISSGVVSLLSLIIITISTLRK